MGCSKCATTRLCRALHAKVELVFAKDEHASLALVLQTFFFFFLTQTWHTLMMAEMISGHTLKVMWTRRVFSLSSFTFSGINKSVNDTPCMKLIPITHTRPIPYHEKHFVLGSTEKKKKTTVGGGLFTTGQMFYLPWNALFTYLAKVNGSAFHSRGA